HALNQCLPRSSSVSLTSQFSVCQPRQGTDARVPRRRGSAEDASLAVALVCMPFASARVPSIQIGLLTAIAASAGCAADSYHLNLELAADLGSDLYESLCEHRGRMTGE